MTKEERAKKAKEREKARKKKQKAEEKKRAKKREEREKKREAKAKEQAQKRAAYRERVEARAREKGGAALRMARKDLEYREFFQEHQTRDLWDYYREKAPQFSEYARVTDEAVTRMMATLLRYERYVNLKDRRFRQMLEEKDKKIKEQERRIKELERQLAEKKADKLGRAEKMDEVSERAGKDFKAIKAKAHAAFRGDAFGEKAGEKASNKKDPYEKLIQTIHEKRRIWIHPSRRQSLMNAERFRETFGEALRARGDSNTEIEELWNYHFGENRSKEDLTQYGLSSDRDEN